MLVLLGKSVPNDPIRSGGWGGVGIGGLYGDTLIRSFRGNASNHQRHIKLSSLPIASKSRIFVFSQDSGGASLPRPRSFSNGYFGSTPKVHRLWVHCFYRPLPPLACFPPQWKNFSNPNNFPPWKFFSSSLVDINFWSRFYLFIMDDFTKKIDNFGHCQDLNNSPY